MTNDQNPASRVLSRELGFKLLSRLIIFHLVIAIAMVLIASIFPTFLDKLPIGGIGLLEEGGDVTISTITDTPLEENNNDLVNSLLEVTGELDRLGYARKLVIVLIGVWLLMLPVYWVHRGVHLGSEHDHSLDETILILPGIVASIVLVVQHSLALAFSLAGIVAGVQFRRALQDTFDALFILVAIGVGLAAGVEALEIAAVLSVFFTYATLYIAFFGDGLETHYVMRKKSQKKLRKTKSSKTEDVEEQDPANE
jgi:hypothetical protein